MKQTVIGGKTYDLREAKMKKSKAYKFGQSLAKDQEVYIKEEFIGKGRKNYTAYKKNDETFTLGLGVTPSEFEYIEETEYIACVERIVSSTMNIKVKAKTVAEAEKKIMELAGSTEFPSATDVEYKFLGTTLTKTQHKQVFGGDK